MIIAMNDIKRKRKAFGFRNSEKNWVDWKEWKLDAFIVRLQSVPQRN